MTTQWFVFGTGAHARKVHQTIVAGGGAVIGFVDENPAAAAPVAGVRMVPAPDLPLPQPRQAMFVAIGRAEARSRLMSQLEAAGWSMPPLVHPWAWVAPDARLGAGVLVAAQAVVEVGSEIGRGCIVDIGALVDHDCRVGDFNHLRPGFVLAAGHAIGDAL
jgi:sugar O-acyltransferase (sialic acid O-acetyltransferase NeuD family)